jgi:hypothetical protein
MFYSWRFNDRCLRASILYNNYYLDKTLPSDCTVDTLLCVSGKACVGLFDHIDPPVKVQ